MAQKKAKKQTKTTKTKGRIAKNQKEEERGKKGKKVQKTYTAKVRNKGGGGYQRGFELEYVQRLSGMSVGVQLLEE